MLTSYSDLDTRNTQVRATIGSGLVEKEFILQKTAGSAKPILGFREQIC